MQARRGASNKSEINGKGYLSFGVIALSRQKSTQSQREPSFFFTKWTGALNGDLEEWMKPIARCSLMNSRRATNLDSDKGQRGRSDLRRLSTILDLDLQVVVSVRSQGFGFTFGEYISKVMIAFGDTLRIGAGRCCCCRATRSLLIFERQGEGLGTFSPCCCYDTLFTFTFTLNI